MNSQKGTTKLWRRKWLIMFCKCELIIQNQTSRDGNKKEKHCHMKCMWIAVWNSAFIFLHVNASTIIPHPSDQVMKLGGALSSHDQVIHVIHVIPSSLTSSCFSLALALHLELKEQPAQDQECAHQARDHQVPARWWMQSRCSNQFMPLLIFLPIKSTWRHESWTGQPFFPIGLFIPPWSLQRRSHSKHTGFHLNHLTPSHQTHNGPHENNCSRTQKCTVKRSPMIPTVPTCHMRLQPNWLILHGSPWSSLTDTVTWKTFPPKGSLQALDNSSSRPKVRNSYSTQHLETQFTTSKQLRWNEADRSKGQHVIHTILCQDEHQHANDNPTLASRISSFPRPWPCSWFPRTSPCPSDAFGKRPSHDSPTTRCTGSSSSWSTLATKR